MAKLVTKKLSIDDPNKLTGPEKAAVILLALGEEHTALWERLDDEEVKEISQAMATLGNVTAEAVEALMIEFVSGLAGSGSVMGSYEQTQRLLAAFLPKDRVDGLMEEIRGPAGRTMWDKLGNVNEAVLANYLKNEYPQTVAVILSKVRSDHAARVLTALPEDFALECVQRMLRMEPVQREILDKIEATLRTEFMSNLARTSKRDSHEMMADIFNSFDRQTEARFIGALEERSRESAERIRALMFVFEDLSKLDPGGVQTLLRAVDKDSLGLALKGASEPLREMFFSNMSERASKIMREDMESMGPVRLKDVDTAQMAMVQVAKDLAARGEIMLAGQGTDDELIY
ncbi:flagellar motor switch protein FliG [Brevundimonas sp. EAKA]|jgi:flagellar motor switch protein FliG|uniref:Flagellar motor switch protein FliG n=1 Tax=Brevundimonas mediterranea TaxID=74329 RepID=A0A6G7EJQ1_9CAUL|nr:flagellar motor switch protein FliG [Brevundimonas mediterranea]EDX81280.1 flagellar motor switch protein FliG [Brevundimonas sp. BAL3]KDP95790.1 flagellar motor switch protein FliG [Brevundimonas sp. EAKA]OGN45585.1 MAG: flagellar motor switch protein FliG [Caulobacterales bacterium RIFCSPHIGHO2_12_FULL_68_13]OGN45597.1 MAG: flagellar motor switch protein FliG [Caulobacterales bacterium RIFCSPHIGHO2_01_FULL_67_30]OGN63408.1 MAG: flagellar motor switch protein FliG [Caulobacterales bacteriu